MIKFSGRANIDMRTDAENHRLIIANTHLVPMLASGFRGVRVIPFDELESAGIVGLVEAAKDWNGTGIFAKYANAAICNQIKDFIRGWSGPEAQDIPGEDSTHEFFLWQAWSDLEYIFAISEYWEELISSPLELREAFEKIKCAGTAIKAANIGFTPRERHILNARYFSEPPSSIETIARHHKISYARTVFLIDRMLKKIRTILESREAASPTALQSAGLNR